MSASRPRGNHVLRDVKMVFDLFVEALQGGTPGQQYVVQFQRGSKEKGSSEPVTATKDGYVDFKFHRSFVSTLQRKNDTSYRKKEFRLCVTEHPAGYILSDLVYDLAGPVVNEVFPNKKLMMRSPNGQSKLLFSLSGISEEDYIQLNSDNHLRAQSGASTTGTSVSRQASVAQTQLTEVEDDDDEPNKPSSQQQAARRGRSEQRAANNKSAPSARREEASPSDEDDDDLGDLVNEAVAQVSGRKGISTPSAAVESKPQARSSSPAPRADQPASESFTGKTASTAPPNDRPPAASQDRAAPPPPPPPPHVDGRSVSPAAVAPPTSTTTNRGETVTRESLEVDDAYFPASKSSVSRRDRGKRSGAGDSTPTNESTARPSVETRGATPSLAGVGTTRNEKEIEKYLSEIAASVVAMSSEALADGASPTVAPTTSSGKHTFNVVSGAKTASSIPRAALLVLHCVKYWSGMKRTMFLHDLFAMLFVDVVPHTRHAAQWMNVLLHVLYHSLTQTDDDVDRYYDPLSDEAAVQLADDLSQCILNAEECAFGSRNTFLVRGSRSDTLFQLLPKEDASDQDTIGGASVPHQVLPMPPGASILLTIAIDESLRRLADTASSTAMLDIEQFCFPPRTPPTQCTSNGYHYTPPPASFGSNQGFGVGGGGPEHPTEDPAFSVVLHALDRLYIGLHGVTKEHPQGASALLRLVGAELFKLIFRNINNVLINHIGFKERNGQWKCRVKTVRDAMNLKLALSMFESWMQEHQLFIAARSELLPCRQVCDLVILHKKLLKNIDLSDEVTSALSPQLVVMLLEAYEPSAKDYPIDEVPSDVVAAFRKAAEEKAKASSKRGGARYELGTNLPPTLPLRSLSTFPFLAFVTSLIPFQDDEVAPGGRKSLRGSIAAASSSKPQLGLGDANEKTATELRTLDWDHNDARLADQRNREAFLGVSTTHDTSGRPLDDREQKDAQMRLGLRVVALSVADDEVIRRTVV